jgi:small conductance mechanosensitive channel
MVFEELLSNTYFRTGIKILLVLFIAFILRFILNKSFSRIVLNIEKKGKKEEIRIKKTKLDIIRKISSAFVFVLAIIVILFLIPGFKEIAYSLLAGAGILAIVIGFGAQKALGNLISGVSIAMYTPFRVGDKLKIFEEFGEVEDITLRHTIVKTWDNKRLVIPNSKMDEIEIVNFSLKGDKVLWTLDIGISYDSDIDKAKKIMLDMAKKHPENFEFEEKVEGKPEKMQPFVRVVKTGDFAVTLRVYYWCKDAWKAWKMSHELIESIKKEFDKKEIEIPFPYRTVVYKKDLEKNK